MAHLFEPLKLRDIVLPNRIGIPPMCQYSAQDGMAAEWHFVHYGSRAVGGAALMIIEATAVTPEGRISQGDLGIWDDKQIEPLSHIAHFARQQGCVAAIQLAHAGRKASVGLGWQAQSALQESEGGWTVVGPSPLSFSADYAQPRELEIAGIRNVVAQFAAGARRAREAGFQIVEIHAAHGYLLHQFLSPLSNRRDDDYGGALANRLRFPLEVFDAVRAAFPAERPVTVRVSGTDWIDGGWTIEETCAFAEALEARGCAAIHVSSGGLAPAKIPLGPGYQVPLARKVKAAVKTPVIAVGLITEFDQAEAILAAGDADLIALARAVLYDPRWPWRAAAHFGAQVRAPSQYLRSQPRELKDLFKA